MSSSTKHGFTRTQLTRIGKHGAALAAAIVLAGLSGPGFADQAPPAGGTATSGTSENALEEIVVTAEFRRENLQTVPIAITAVTAETMDERNMTNLVDVATVAPNVTMFVNTAAFGKTNAAFIRGIGEGDFNLAASEPGVGIYIDDVYFATTLGSQFDLYDLESIDIERGPQGTLQGENTIGGAILIHSKQPTGDGSGFVDVTLGDFSRRDFKAAYDMSIVPDTLFLRVSAFEEYRNGYVTRLSYNCANPQPAAGQGTVLDSRGYTVNTDAPQYIGGAGYAPNSLGGNCDIGNEGGIDVRGARAQLRWLITDKMEDSLTGYVIDDNSEAAAETLVTVNTNSALAGWNPGLLKTYGEQIDSRFLTNNFYTNYSNFFDLGLQIPIPDTDSMHQWGLSNVFDWQFAEKAHFKSITAALGYWTGFSDDQFNEPLPAAWAYNLVAHRQFTQEFRLTGNAFGQLDWAAGAFYYRGISTNQGEIDVQVVGLPPFQQNSPAITQNEALFGQVTEHITDQLDLTAGVRATHEDKEYVYQSFFGRLGPYGVEYSHVDWKAALDYKLTPDLMAYVSASTGFRGGGFNSRPFAASQINEYEPEKLTEYEIGLKSDWFEHKLRANVDGFYGNYTNLQFPTQLIVAGIPYDGTSNIGAANIYGYEAEIQARPFGGLAIDGSVGYTGFKYKDLGSNVGCQAIANPIPSPAIGANCIAGNPGYSDYPVGQPKFKGNVGAAYDFLIPGGSKLTPRLDATYQSRVFADVVNQTPGAIISPHIVLNGRVQWDAANGKWSIAALGTNLTNKQYYIGLFDLRAFGEGMESGTPAPPRMYAINVKYNFK
jgi:iron complex outermembrane receptor protein